MGAGFGFMRDAQNRANQNRDLLKDKINFQKNHQVKTPHMELKFKEATAGEMQKFRTELLRKKRIETIKLNILRIFIVLGLAWAFWWIFFE
jgi:cytoskeletal protein RodZ